MRKLASLVLLATLLGGVATVSVAAPARAATAGLTETGVTTYQLVPDKGLIHVTVVLSLHNSKPDAVSTYKCGQYQTCTERTRYWWNYTFVIVENEAPAIAASSDAGSVAQSVVSNESGYRTIKLSFPNVYYGQTRKVTVTYDIKGGAPRSNNLFRAGKAYANFCFGGQGEDSGSVTAVIPAGFRIQTTSGDATHTSSSNGATTVGSGTIAAPDKFFACLEATNTDALAPSTVKSGSQQFTVRAWPEDREWSSKVSSYVSSDFAKLSSMIGLPVPGSGPIEISEAANSQLGAYDGFYDPETRTAEVSETADPATVAHELSHIWFNDTLFRDTWMGEGFAGYAEQVAGTGTYTACTAPGRYPGSGSPDITIWPRLDTKATKQQQAVLDYDYAAACWIVTDVAGQIGADRLKQVFAAASEGQIAYVAPGVPPEKLATAEAPLDARHLLDLLDERGMVPAGVKDLDAAQKLLGQYGVFPAATLDARSKARAAYHALEASAGEWTLPIAIRMPMADWDFPTAQAAMKTASEILRLRDGIRAGYGEAALNSTAIRSDFEKAADQKALDGLLATVQHEAEAADAVTAAAHTYNEQRGMIEQIGLLGTDLQTPLNDAATAVAEVRPDDAIAAANTVTDTLANATSVGTMRVAIAGGTVVGLIVLLALLIVWRRRRRRVVVMAPGSSPAGAIVVPAVGSDEWSVWRAPEQIAAPPPADEATQTWSAAPPPPPPASPPLEQPVTPEQPAAPADENLK